MILMNVNTTCMTATSMLAAKIPSDRTNASATLVMLGVAFKMTVIILTNVNLVLTIVISKEKIQQTVLIMMVASIVFAKRVMQIIPKVFASTRTNV